MVKKCSCPDGYSFENRIEGYTVFYGRDRGEEETEYKVSEERPTVTEEYLYVFEDGKWFVSSIHFDAKKPILELTQKLIDSDK